MVPDRQSSVTSAEAMRPGDTAGSSLEDPAMVPTTPGDVGGLPTNNRKSFQRKLPRYSSSRGESKLTSHNMTHFSVHGTAGAIEGVQIPFLVL